MVSTFIKQDTPTYLYCYRPVAISHDHCYLSCDTNERSNLLNSAEKMMTNGEKAESEGQKKKDTRPCILCTVKGDQLSTVRS